MTRAPVWSMSPMSNPRLETIPLQFLASDAKTPMDSRTTFFTYRDYRNGTALTSETRPGGLWFGTKTTEFGEEDLDAKLATTKVFIVNSLVFLAKSVAAQLNHVDLGDGAFFEMPILYPDLETRFQRDFVLLAFTNAKDTVLREATEGCRPVFPTDPAKGYELPQSLDGHQVIVQQAAAAGPDVWFDPMIKHVQFCSDAFAKALTDQGLKGHFKLNPCYYLDA